MYIPSNAFVYKGHSYYLFNKDMTWTEAKEYCENLGGHLVTITDENEQIVIEKLFYEKGTKNNYWLGGFKDDNDNWKWTTGEKIFYQNWGYEQPDNFTGEENSLMIYKNKNPLSPAQPRQWNDVNSDGTCNDETFFGKENFGFICEWDNEDNQDTNSERTFYLNQGYHQGDGYKYEGGLFVTNFNFDKNSNGENSISFDVYNTKDANGIVEYYDKNGKFISADIIEPHSVVIKDFSSWWEKAKNTFDSIAKYGFGDVPITHPSVSTQTRIEDVPTETSKIIVTNNQSESIYAYVYNMVDNFYNGFEIAKNLKSILGSYKEFKNGTSEALIDKTKGKITEQFVKKFQQALKDTVNDDKYETGISLIIKLDTYNIKEMVLNNFDFEKYLEDALEYALKNSGNIVLDQVTDIAYSVCSKLFEGNPALLGLDAITFIGNSLDSLSKVLTQKQLENSKPMIFQLGVSQSSESNNLAPLNDRYGYRGGNKNITDYVFGEKIEFFSDYSGFDFTDRDFKLKSSSGDLTIKNARDKIMDVAVNGNTVAYAYMASGSGEINGSGLSSLEVIIGGNNLANQIIAGSGGSSLWGGSGGNDVLTGGSGQLWKK